MAQAITHPDQMYIEGLAQNNSAIIQSIYKKFVPKVIHYIKNNSGDEDQAQDVVQEVLIVLFDQAKAKKLHLTCPFDAYFFLLCKRKWLNELKKTSNKGVTLDDNFTSNREATDELAAETELFESQQQLFDAMFQKLGEKCQEVLKLSFALKSMEEVAQKLNVTYGYVRKKKSLCTGQLTQWIQESSHFTTLK
ncbi:sigma-70 family RNA polymerase sigma factor [Flavobacterium sp. NG2]|uniref:RNA polymerase sigma factor n=1 Tax=Flavobacterium sp. NG2 TaxID=3097547 RepID=UPI002A7EB678|nr:sigma-70 family RNA polymerase sigma factor [Flavobacterium sp. NG2]WPR71941.1 sigma-70 family RNA polymerase sigma factor [Flavobacterium sp. NG2]